MFVGQEHVAIASPNPPSLAQWYVDHLGFTVILVKDGNYFVRASNGSLIEIISGQGPLADFQPLDCGIRHLAIQVSDFDAAYASLAERKVRFLAPPYLSNGNRAVVSKMVFFKDGEGNLCHLIQRSHESAQALVRSAREKEPLP